MKEFHSPCQCGKFEPRVTYDHGADYFCKLPDKPNHIVIVCKNCGRHEPKKSE